MRVRTDGIAHRTNRPELPTQVAEVSVIDGTCVVFVVRAVKSTDGPGYQLFGSWKRLYTFWPFPWRQAAV